MGRAAMLRLEYQRRDDAIMQLFFSGKSRREICDAMNMSKGAISGVIFRRLANPTSGKCVLEQNETQPRISELSSEQLAAIVWPER